MRDKLVVYNVSSSKTPPLAVPKREDIMRRLDAYRKGGEQGDLGERYQYVSGLPVEILFFRRGRHSRGRGGERDDRERCIRKYLT